MNIAQVVDIVTIMDENFTCVEEQTKIFEFDLALLLCPNKKG